MDRPRFSLMTEKNRYLMSYHEKLLNLHHFPGMQRLPEQLVVKKVKRLSDGRSMCMFCQYISKHSGSMKDHMIGKHSIIQNLKCDYCSKTYKNSYALRQHCKKYHYQARFQTKVKWIDPDSPWLLKNHYISCPIMKNSCICIIFQVCKDYLNTWWLRKWRDFPMAD